MQYLLLIYDRESAWAAMSEADPVSRIRTMEQVVSNTLPGRKAMRIDPIVALRTE
jgi:hypothetical protein